MRKIYCILCVLCAMVASASAQNINRIEYFFNTDPGFGHATALTGFTPAADVAEFQASINLGSIPMGVYNLYLRAKDSDGNWSITNVIPFVKVEINTTNIVSAEYFFNTDPGIGKATAITGFTPSADVAKFPLSINLGSVPLGVNSLYVRARDANGNWSITNMIPFVKVVVNANNIVKAEYFFNTDPGFGKATAIAGFTPSTDVASIPVSINLSSIPNGVNNLYVRAQDGNGNWCITNVIPFVKVDVSIPDIVRAEYFINTDPGFGKATPITLPVSADINKQALILDILSTPLGVNTLFVRTEDSKGNWSLTNYFAFIKGTAESEISPVSMLEYYIDIDPGFGKGTPVSLVPPAQNINSYAFDADVSSVAMNTMHNLFVRARDANGVWSLTNIVSFKKMSGVGMDEYLDASAAFKAFPNPAFDKITVQCSPAQKMDKIELMDIHGKFIQVQSSGNSTEKQIDMSKLTKGIYFIRITSGNDNVFKKVVKE
jgi:hypothetical protein